jgi:DNA-binding CsgD family transcriptional regulator
VQALAAVFFLGDVVADLSFGALTVHLMIEALVAAALVAGLLVGAVALRRTLERMRAQEASLDAARGALGEVIKAEFDRWRLTAAECDVAMLALKGLDVAEIAALRGAAGGTVRAQLSRVYAKAGVSGRAQFAALFVEDLLADGVSGRTGASP